MLQLCLCYHERRFIFCTNVVNIGADEKQGKLFLNKNNKNKKSSDITPG